MAQIKFSGTVSAQTASGETVTLTVTKPDGTKETFPTPTLPDKTYGVTKTYTVAGTYSVSVHQNADSQYSSWDAGPTTFVVALEPRTGTLTVTVA